MERKLERMTSFYSSNLLSEALRLNNCASNFIAGNSYRITLGHQGFANGATYNFRFEGGTILLIALKDNKK